MSGKKSYFQERTAEQICGMRLQSVYSARGLVERISGLDPSCEALQLMVRITPSQFYRGASGAEASRKCYKHGDYMRLSQPLTRAAALECRDIPLAIRERDFAKLAAMKEEVNCLGYSFVPVQGRDRTRRVVPFVWLLEAERLFAYAENYSPYEDVDGSVKMGIKVDDRYADSKRARKEGAQIVCEVPSRSKKRGRYTIKLVHVPVDGSTERRAIVWSLKPAMQLAEDCEPDGERPMHDTYRLKYGWESERKESADIVFYPHDIAAYMAIAGKFWKKHNLTPMEMNPFALFSRKGADFYKKLCSNVVIFDPTLGAKDKRRKLHIDEKSILLARAIGKFGHGEFAYWDPVRDGKLKDYDWNML